MATLAKDKQEIFESLPIPKAVAKLVVPSVLSQLVTLIYNIADAFFIGRTGDPFQMAAMSEAYIIMFILIAVTNLFGVGGGSFISRLLGAKRDDEVKHVTTFSLYVGLITTAVVLAVLMIFMQPFLTFIGSSDVTRGYNYQYIFWVGIVGGLPTAASMLFAHLLRSEGHARPAGIGIAAGGILNIILDPIFILGFGMGVTGAAIATMLSNVFSMLYYIVVFVRLKGKTVLLLDPKYISLRGEYVKPTFAIGLPAFFATVLTAYGTMLTIKLMAGYGDYEVAAYGIVKKLDLLMYYICVGISYGVLPLIAYNYSAKNYKRMNKARNAALLVAVGAGVIYTAAGTLIPSKMVRFFIDDDLTVAIGAVLVSIECLSTPLVTINDIFGTTFQAMGKGKQSMLLMLCRNGIVRIPLILLMNKWFGMLGIVWSQLVTNVIMLVVTFLLYGMIMKKLKAEQEGGIPPQTA